MSPKRQESVKTMKDLHIEVIRPCTPQQTCLDERLQSARWLGWAMPTPPRSGHPEPVAVAQTALAPAQGSPA